MSRRYFGTDGIRGTFGDELINPSFFRRLGRVVKLYLDEERPQGPHEVLVGRDSRESGRVLEDALFAGLGSRRVKIVSLGIIPTPGVSIVCRDSKADLAAMITASHNPAEDNGIKFFDTAGMKINDDAERWIERMLENQWTDTLAGFEGELLDCDGAQSYLDILRPLFSSINLRNWKIVADTANGATVNTTPRMLSELGAEVIQIGDSIDGKQVNRGVGSEHPEVMAERVRREHARLGIAHDGDGDRVVFCDETGSILNGDEVLAIIGLEALRKGFLNNRTLVATVMSNLGLDQALERSGGRVERVPVGDRNVAAKMNESGYNIGGEASGHIILGDHSPSGDGLIAILEIIEIMKESGKPLSHLRRCIELFPLLKCDLRVSEKIPMQDLPDLRNEIERLEGSHTGRGRILVRYSGTEPLIRLLVEGENAEWVRRCMAQLKDAVAIHLTVM